MATAHTPSDPDAVTAALDKAATKVERLEKALTAARHERHRLIREADALTVAGGQRAFTKYRIAQLARVRPQAVDQVLAKPAPEDDQ